MELNTNRYVKHNINIQPINNYSLDILKNHFELERAPAWMEYRRIVKASGNKHTSVLAHNNLGMVIFDKYSKMIRHKLFSSPSKRYHEGFRGYSTNSSLEARFSLSKGTPRHKSSILIHDTIFT